MMEEYAQTKCKPLPYFTLHNWYLQSSLKSKAQDALKRGVTERDPQAVVKSVR